MTIKFMSCGFNHMMVLIDEDDENEDQDPSPENEDDQDDNEKTTFQLFAWGSGSHG